MLRGDDLANRNEGVGIIMSPSVIPAWRNSGEERTGELLAQGLYVA